MRITQGTVEWVKGYQVSLIVENVFCVEGPRNRLMKVESTGLPSCYMDEDNNLNRRSHAARH